MVADLPLQLISIVDTPTLYCAVLQLYPAYAWQRPPLLLESTVVVGAGRGSKEMGTPTANMDMEGLGDSIAGLCKGVYLGYVVFVVLRVVLVDALG